MRPAASGSWAHAHRGVVATGRWLFAATTAAAEPRFGSHGRSQQAAAARSAPPPPPRGKASYVLRSAPQPGVAYTGPPLPPSKSNTRPSGHMPAIHPPTHPPTWAACAADLSHAGGREVVLQVEAPGAGVDRHAHAVTHALYPHGVLGAAKRRHADGLPHAGRGRAGRGEASKREARVFAARWAASKPSRRRVP